MSDREDDRNTRDLAVEAKTKADLHIQDCTMFRLRLAEDFSDVKKSVVASRTAAENGITEVRNDLKRQTWYLALIVGGLIAFSRAPDMWKFLHGG